MRKLFWLLLLLSLFVGCERSISAQQGFLHIKCCEVDGKETKQDFTMFFVLGEKKIKPKVSHERYVIPPEIESADSFDVEIVTSKYKLYFQEVNNSKLETNWLIGIDTKPFSDENTHFDTFDHNVNFIYYVRFVSPKGDSIVQTVLIKAPNSIIQ